MGLPSSPSRKEAVVSDRAVSAYLVNKGLVPPGREWKSYLDEAREAKDHRAVAWIHHAVDRWNQLTGFTFARPLRLAERRTD